jgi:hypothetical protein
LTKLEGTVINIPAPIPKIDLPIPKQIVKGIAVIELPIIIIQSVIIIAFLRP